MIEKVGGALDVVIHAINNKITNLTIAAGVAFTGQAAQVAETPQLKSLAEIPVTEIFSHDLNAASVATIIGSGYIIFQFTREIIKGVIWLWRRRND